VAGPRSPHQPSWVLDMDPRSSSGPRTVMVSHTRGSKHSCWSIPTPLCSHHCTSHMPGCVLRVLVKSHKDNPLHCEGGGSPGSQSHESEVTAGTRHPRCQPSTGPCSESSDNEKANPDSLPSPRPSAKSSGAALATGTLYIASKSSVSLHSNDIMPQSQCAFPPLPASFSGFGA
jgi:hypothetical protein